MQNMEKIRLAVNRVELDLRGVDHFRIGKMDSRLEAAEHQIKDHHRHLVVSNRCVVALQAFATQISEWLANFDVFDTKESKLESTSEPKVRLPAPVLQRSNLDPSLCDLYSGGAIYAKPTTPTPLYSASPEHKPTVSNPMSSATTLTPTSSANVQRAPSLSSTPSQETSSPSDRSVVTDTRREELAEQYMRLRPLHLRETQHPSSASIATRTHTFVPTVSPPSNARVAVQTVLKPLVPSEVMSIPSTMPVVRGVVSTAYPLVVASDAIPIASPAPITSEIITIAFPSPVVSDTISTASSSSVASEMISIVSQPASTETIPTRALVAVREMSQTTTLSPVVGDIVGESKRVNGIAGAGTLFTASENDQVKDDTQNLLIEAPSARRESKEFKETKETKSSNNVDSSTIVSGSNASVRTIDATTSIATPTMTATTLSKREQKGIAMSSAIQPGPIRVRHGGSGTTVIDNIQRGSFLSTTQHPLPSASRRSPDAQTLPPTIWKSIGIEPFALAYRCTATSKLHAFLKDDLCVWKTCPPFFFNTSITLNVYSSACHPMYLFNNVCMLIFFGFL
jgi:hypothetical protein